MRFAALALAVVLSNLAYSAPPQPAGTFTEKDPGKTGSTTVRHAVAVFDGDQSELWVFMFSSEPSARQLSTAKKGRNPDADAFVQLSWKGEAATSVGDARKAHLWVKAEVNNHGYNVGVNPGASDLSLAGALKEGQEITLTGKGSGSSMAWDLNVKAKVFNIITE
jgi:hypothetical protein